MKKTGNSQQLRRVIENRKVRHEWKKNFPADINEGYPEYPATEDIYRQYLKEQELNPEDPTTVKRFDTLDEVAQDLDKDFNHSGGDLDIPGSELDDDQEVLGSEDEENNFYSLGGDDHNALEENEDDRQ
jgi:hypothetical protein